MTERLTAEAEGTWIDGSWGQYAPDRIISIADDYGFTGSQGNDDEKWIDVAVRRSQELHRFEDEREQVYLWDVQIELADEALHYMNTTLAAEGWSFDWFEGELHYHSDEWWEEVYE